MYREHERRGQLDRLDPRVRLVCDLLKDRGCLLKPTGGRPTADYRAILIAADVKEAIDRHSGTWGSKEPAYREVAERDRASYDHVKDLYLRAFSHNHDREFRRAVDLELSQRKKPEG